MQLFLIRHARAEDRSPDVDDAARPLTKRGRREFARAVRRLDRAGVQFDLVLHSPLLRAIETADLLTPLVDGETRVTPRLAEPPGFELLEHLTGDRTALVGHEPWLSELVFWLVTGWRIHEHPDHAPPFRLQKGAVAWLEGEPRPGAMTLVALLPPSALRKRSRDR